MRPSFKYSLAAGAALFGSATAHAALALTQAGIDRGFSLTKFFSDPATNYYGVLGLANASDGTLIGTGYQRGQLYKFNDADGQTLSSALAKAAFAGSWGVTSVGGKVYATSYEHAYYTVANDLTVTPLALTREPRPIYGFWANQSTGHLLSSSTAGLIDIDPAAGTWKVVGPYGADGVSVSPNGKTAYGEYGSSIIRGYDIATGQKVYDSGALGHGPDGTGVIFGGPLDGQIIVNNNDGTIGLLDPTGVHPYTIIASGGSRGDIVSPDLSNGTLLLAFSADTWRLSCGPGCSIGGPVVPEPDTVAMALAGMAALGVIRLRRARLHRRMEAESTRWADSSV